MRPQALSNIGQDHGIALSICAQASPFRRSENIWTCSKCLSAPDVLSSGKVICTCKNTVYKKQGTIGEVLGVCETRLSKLYDLVMQVNFPVSLGDADHIGSMFLDCTVS